ncbi:MAG: efflux RND transporter periplasmic adaptor subunit [Anaerolineae bacterium]
MKRGIIVLLLLVVVAGALAGGWWWARTSPEQATEFLVNGGLEAARAEEFVAQLGGRAGSVEEQAMVVSGSIEGEEVTIVSEFGGRIISLDVEEGDQVEVGHVLVELDTSLLQADMAQAEAGAMAAEANLANVKAGTHPAEIMAAQALLQQAIAERSAAETAWRDSLAVLGNPQEIEAQVAEARAAVDLAAVQIEQMEAQLASAKVERDRYRAQGSMEEKWLYVIYNYQVEAAEAALDAARANRQGAEETLATLEALRDNPLAVVSEMHMAEAQYDIAVAGVAVAKAKLDELQAGPTAEEVAVAEAQVAQARSAISALETKIEKMTLRSPIAGLVTSRSVHEGEAAIAGATLLSVANLDEVQLTVYIPEDELGRVYLGQQVEVQVDSFPGRVFTGTVSYISQQAEFTPRNVQTEEERVNMVFAVRVRLPNPDHLLKPGMPADAVISD